MSSYHEKKSLHFEYSLTQMKLLSLNLLISLLLIHPNPKGAKKPIYPVPNWAIVAPASENMDTLLLSKADMEIQKNQVAVRGILVTRNGKIVYEKYYRGFTPDSTFNIWSVTKSVMSILTGIAIGRKELDSAGQKICLLLPKEVSAGIHSGCKEITLAQLLTMSSGISWYFPGTTTMIKRYDEQDKIYASPPLNPPGTVFRYDGASAHTVSLILKNATHTPVEEYANQHLFKPLGITKYFWEKDKNDYNLGAEGLHLTMRDLAKIGYLCLRNGKWGKKQIISSAYLQQSTTLQNKGGFPGNDGYGYLWWISKTAQEPTYYALGSGGIIMAITPSLNMVTVITTDLASPQADLYKPRQLIYDYILPAGR